jgi:fucose permease
MSICKGTEPSAARSSADARPDGSIVETDTPARLDRLPWGRFHTLVVVALGITWVLDGLEVTLAGAVSPALKESPRLHFSNADVGLASSAYIAGAVLGALFFGWLTDRLGALWFPPRRVSVEPRAVRAIRLDTLDKGR